MAIKVHYGDTAKVNLLKGKTVAIIGYGSQGHAHALNLRDSGVTVVVGMFDLKDPTAAAAKKAGFPLVSIEKAVQAADVIMILVPDEFQADAYQKSISPTCVRAR